MSKPKTKGKTLPEEQYDVAVAAYTKIQKRMEDLAALIERGVDGERVAAQNAYDKARLDWIQAQIDVIWKYLKVKGI